MVIISGTWFIFCDWFKKGTIQVEFSQKPIGLQLAPRSDGPGVTVSGYDNLALQDLVPPESTLIQINDIYVEKDSQESIQQLFHASELPILCTFEMNPVTLFSRIYNKNSPTVNVFFANVFFLSGSKSKFCFLVRGYL